MKKLSKIMTESIEQDIKADVRIPSIDDREATSWQSLILFDGVLDSDAVLQNLGVGYLVTYLYGKPLLSLVHTEYAEKLQDWLRDEMYKANVGQRSMVSPLKVSFEELATENHSKDYSGPVNAMLFKPEPAQQDIIVITCNWNDGLFRNDFAVIGVIADTEDLEAIIEEKIR